MQNHLGNLFSSNSETKFLKDGVSAITPSEITPTLLIDRAFLKK